MNREIKFRGLRKDGKGWVCGDLVRKATETFIGRNILHRRAGGRKVLIYTETEIIPETVGQFTGRHDKNGVEIYDSDKFSPEKDHDEFMAIVRWDDKFSKYVVDSYGYDLHIGEGSQEVYDNALSICDTTDLGDISSGYLEVIGNIHEKEVTND